MRPKVYATSEGEFVDEFGHPVTANGRRISAEHREEYRSKMMYPYSYTPIVQYESRRSDLCNGDAYTDRMVEWDHKLFEECAKLHMPMVRFDNARPEQIQAFIRAYQKDETLELVRVTEFCLPTGYPTWRIDWYKPKA